MVKGLWWWPTERMGVGDALGWISVVDFLSVVHLISHHYNNSLSFWLFMMNMMICYCTSGNSGRLDIWKNYSSLVGSTTKFPTRQSNNIPTFKTSSWPPFETPFGQLYSSFQVMWINHIIPITLFVFAFDNTSPASVFFNWQGIHCENHTIFTNLVLFE